MPSRSHLFGFRALYEWYFSKGITLYAVTRDGVFFKQAAEKNHQFFAALQYLRVPHEEDEVSASYAYASFPSLRQFLAFESTLLPFEKHWFERVMDKPDLHQACRIFLDIEYYPRNDDERNMEKDVIDAVFAELSFAIETITGETPSREHTLRILTSHNSKKVSLHMHMINVGHFASMSKLKVFVQDLRDRCKKNYPRLASLRYNEKDDSKTDFPIDMSVYASAQNFRLVGHSKATAPERFLQRHASCADAPTEDFLITGCDGSTRVLEWNAVASDDTNVSEATADRADARPHIASFTGNTTLLQKFLSETFNVTERISAVKASTDTSGNMFIWFARPIYCPNMGRPHSQVPHTFFVAHRRLKKVYLKCNDCRCKNVHLQLEEVLPPYVFDELWPEDIIVGNNFEEATSAVITQYVNGYGERSCEGQFLYKRPREDQKNTILTLEPKTKKTCVHNRDACTCLEIQYNGNVVEHCGMATCPSHPKHMSKLPMDITAFIRCGWNTTTNNFLTIGNPNDLLADNVMPQYKLKYYNDRFIQVLAGSKQIVYEIDKDRYIPYEEFKKHYLYDKELIRSKEMINGILARWAELWLQHKSARRFSDIQFAPGNGLVFDDGKTYNLWRGFAVDPDATKDFAPFLTLVKRAICSDDEALYEYVLNWLAFGVQKPAVKCETSIILRGDQGSGKGSMATIYGSLFGKHFTHAKNKEDYLGKFNSNLEICKILFVDESTFGGNKEEAGKIKTLITEKTMTIERKFMDKRNVQNCFNILIASNNDWPVPVDVGDRRFLCINPLNTFKGDFEFFNELHDCMNNRDGSRGLLAFLLDRDIASFNPRQLPKSKTVERERLSLQIETFDAVTSYALYLIHADEIPEQPISLLMLYQDFKANMSTAKNILGITAQCMTKKLKQCFGDTFRKKRLENSNVWVFTSRYACAGAFARFLKCDVNLILKM